MDTAIFTLSSSGLNTARFINKVMPADIYVHEDVLSTKDIFNFSSIIDCTEENFWKYKKLIYIMPCGVVIRAISKILQNKLQDPAVVVTDVLGRCVISLLSGHEGGANDLAYTLSDILRAEPIITTTSEMEKNIICGIGCRKGVTRDEILMGISKSLEKVNMDIQRVRILATIDIKKTETGLLEVAKFLNLPIRFFTAQELLQKAEICGHSKFVQETVGTPAVAEPAALLAGNRTKLILRKIIWNKVTVALARENYLWSE